MSRFSLYTGMDRFFAQRKFGGFRSREIARLVLASWLFSLVLCIVNAWAHDQVLIGYLGSVTHSYMDSYPEHGSDAQDEDACCGMMQDNPTVPSHAINALPKAFDLTYVLLSCIVILQLIRFAGSGISFFSSSPPGKPGAALIANSLWPNAPPTALR